MTVQIVRFGLKSVFKLHFLTEAPEKDIVLVKKLHLRHHMTTFVCTARLFNCMIYLVKFVVLEKLELFLREMRSLVT